MANKNQTIEINIQRLEYLLKLYSISKNELLNILNANRKIKFSIENIFQKNLSLTIIKKIDEIFKKGLNFYTDKNNIKDSDLNSIFFRKNKFNAQLNLAARQTVISFETESSLLSAYSKLSDFDIPRKLKKYSLNDVPKKVAGELCELYPKYQKDSKVFLKALIEKLSEQNIIVFEFLVAHNTKVKPNIEGFYIKPNIIVIKRNQKYLKREIFTLAHELAHYFLDEEEIDESISFEDELKSISKIERWCNEFAFYFLIQSELKQLEELNKKNKQIDFYKNIIEDITNKTHISSLSIYTYLLYNKIISKKDYSIIKNEIEVSIQKKEREERIRLSSLPKNKKFSQPKPIQSPIFKSIMDIAYREGIISEAEYCTKLKLKNLAMEGVL